MFINVKIYAFHYFSFFKSNHMFFFFFRCLECSEPVHSKKKNWTATCMLTFSFECHLLPSILAFVIFFLSESYSIFLHMKKNLNLSMLWTRLQKLNSVLTILTAAKFFKDVISLLSCISDCMTMLYYLSTNAFVCYSFFILGLKAVEPMTVCNWVYCVH